MIHTRALATLLPTLLIATTLITGPARAQDTLAPPVPLPSEQPPPPAPGPSTLTELAARRALETGLPSIAAEIYRQLLAGPASAATPEARNRMILGQVTALIEDDRIDEASEALRQFTGDPTPALLLRQAMIDVRARRFDKARATAATILPEDLPPADHAWLFFLRGILAEEARNYTEAGKQYQQAEAATTDSVQHAWFALSRMRARLLLGQAGDNAIASLRQTIDRYPGTRNGYGAVSQLAVTLNAAGRRAEAITLLQTQLQSLASQETDIRDDWLLLFGLIAGPDDNAGRDALRRLLATSADRDKQRAALRLLANASRTKERAAEFGSWLNQLISATPPHPILDDLLLFRAQLALADNTNKNYAAAENDVTRLLAEFPGSPLRAAALGVQAAIAWEQGRFRAAADWASRARAELKSGPTYAQLGVLIAEAYFRAKDYRNASAAYGSALADIPDGVSPGDLIFQRVLSEMQTGPNGDSLASAQEVLDSYADDPRFDPVSRWQAEWNLARALQAAGETAQAYARVNKLLSADAANAGALPPDLRARMAWLQMRLAYDSGNYQQAAAYAEKLKTSLSDVTRKLHDEITSMTLLLEVETAYALATPGQPGAADTGALLQKLRAEYPETDAAARSYIIEAAEAAKRDRLVEAQGLLRKLADDYRGTPYASYALLQAAAYAESRGPEQYRDANRLLEELIQNEQKANLGAQSEYIFQARLRQGNLARRINDFGSAINIYRELVNRYKFPEYPEGLIAELALADSYAALVNTDASYAESAAAIYERLLDLPGAPIDLRIEAGHKFGLNLIARKDYARLEATWGQMISDFLLDDARAAKLGATGRYWMARTLLKLGELLEEQSKNTQAREAYQLIITKNLPGAALAQDRISRGAR